MKVFVTGASGFIGRSTITALVAHGHEVIGLARTEKSASTIKDLGGVPHQGDLDNLESLKSGAAQADAVIHLAFMHDAMMQGDLMKAQIADRAAINALADGLSGKNAPLIIASGTLSLPHTGSPSTEDVKPPIDGSAFSERFKAAALVEDLSRDGKVKGMIVRFAPTVHGAGDWGFMKMAIDGMKAAGEAIYVGEGKARWPACQVDDAATLLALAVVNGTSGATYHAITEEGVSLKAVAELIGQRLNLPVVSKQVPEAVEKLHFLGGVMGIDNYVSSDRTQKELGWTPKNIGLLEDLEKNYF